MAKQLKINGFYGYKITFKHPDLGLVCYRNITSIKFEIYAQLESDYFKRVLCFTRSELSGFNAVMETEFNHNFLEKV